MGPLVFQQSGVQEEGEGGDDNTNADCQNWNGFSDNLEDDDARAPDPSDLDEENLNASDTSSEEDVGEEAVLVSSHLHLIHFASPTICF